MSGAGRLEVIMGPGGQEVPAGSRLGVVLRVVLEEALEQGALQVMVGWEQLGRPGGLHVERVVREGAWEAGVHEVPFGCQLRLEPATARGEPGAMWFVAARLGSLEHRVYFRLTPRGEGAVARRDVDAFLSEAPASDGALSPTSDASTNALALKVVALLVAIAIFMPWKLMWALWGVIGVGLGLRWLFKGEGEQEMALTRPVLELSALEFEPGDEVGLQLSFTARRAVQLKAAVAALVVGERRIELNRARRERVAPEEIVRFDERGREQRVMSGARSLAAGEAFEEEMWLALPPDAQLSGLDGTGMVWRAQVRLTFEGLEPLEDEVFFRVRSPGLARRRAEEQGGEVEDEGGEVPGSGW